MTKRKKKQQSKQQGQRKPVVGVAWYTAEQWDRLKLLADDPEALDDTYNDWLNNATRNIRALKEQGLKAVKVSIDVDEWAIWCQENGEVLNGTSRALFTSKKASELYGIFSSSGELVSRQIKPRKNPIPFLDSLETLFEAKRDKSIPPPYPFDQNSNTIRLPREIEAELQQLARNGNKIEAVKKVTKLTGAGLRVSKDYVDSLIP